MTRPIRSFAPRITLEQWRVLRAVVQQGGYAQAAESLHKSQSAVTYAIQKMESVLDMEIFTLQGRRAVLTDAGNVLYRRSRHLLEEAAALEETAGRLAAGQESEIRLAVDTVFPTWLLLECLGTFADEAPDTRIELYETVLGGTLQALTEKQVDLAIGGDIPQGVIGDPLLRVRFIAVAAPHHPLHRVVQLLTLDDLRQHRQLVIRDSSSDRSYNAGWLDAEQRWTVSHKATSIRAVCMGLGFAWFPEHVIADELASGALKPLPLVAGAQRYAELYLLYSAQHVMGVGVKRLRELLHRAAHRTECQQTSSKA